MAECSKEDRFRNWIYELDEQVIQGEFGYESGEFDVFPEMWRPLFDEGLTPRQAWQRAMDAHRQAREEEDRAKAANWERIKIFLSRSAAGSEEK